ncbi:MAG: terminase TerL endonuclease subunit [Sphingomonadaceae bacterium]|nr:terminase TerL endonuclease subunit [Sphingomonadaceae bacterium]
MASPEHAHLHAPARAPAGGARPSRPPVGGAPPAAEAELLPYEAWVEAELPPTQLLDRTTEYARWVIAGGRVAGCIERGSCARHLADLEGGDERDLVWRPDEAERVIDFYPQHFSITDGPAAGQPFALLPWMLFTSGSLFGWAKHGAPSKAGERKLRWRFQNAWLETGKGQGKSPYLAATGILAISAFARRRAEAFAVAPKEDQAMVVLRDAAAFLRGPIPHEDEGVTWEGLGKFKIYGLNNNADNIIHNASKSFFLAQGGNALKVSGPRPVFVSIDEVHELPDGRLIDMWLAAVEKVAEGGIVLEATNTPALDQAYATARAAERHAIALGEAHDDSVFVFAARADDADGKVDPETGLPRIVTRPELWGKALPALADSFPLENAYAIWAKARASSSDRARALRLYGGLSAGAIDFWMEDASLWEAAREPVDEAKLVNLPCYLALDLSSKNDLTGLSACWVDAAPGQSPDEARRITKDWGWTVEERLAERAKADRAPYEAWVRDGQLTAVPGGAIEYEYVAGQVAALVATHDVQLLAVDPHKLGDFIKACERIGLKVWLWQGPDQPRGQGLKIVKHAQGTRVVFEGLQLCMPRSIEKLEDLLLRRAIVVDRNPVSNACAYNAAIERDAKENRAFDKKRSRGRIDLLVSKTMAVGASFGEAKKKGPARLSIL